MTEFSFISKGQLMMRLNQLGNHAPEDCLPGISLVTKEVFNMSTADIAIKMADELKTARMDGRREGVADGYKAGWNAALAMIEEMAKNEHK